MAYVTKNKRESKFYSNNVIDENDITTIWKTEMRKRKRNSL